MPEASTPDSVPSLGDVTAASSDTEEGVAEDVTRVLFPSVHQRKWEDFIARMKASVPSRDAERESLFDSDQSILGSDQSVSFLDLAVDTSSIVDSRIEKPPRRGQNINLVRTSSDSKLSDVEARAEANQTEPSVAEKIAARFTGPLSKSQLVSIFSLCDGGEGVIWSNSPTIDEHSHMTDRPRKNITIEEPVSSSYSGVSWMPQAQSLARECATLKEIIRVDSANILQLRQGLDHLKNINKEQVSQIEILGNRLLEAKSKLDFLEREKEILQFRDVESQRTIGLLKEELDQLLQSKQQHWFRDEQENDLMMTDLEQLRFENELFAAQVVENEKKLRAVTVSLKEAESENGQLKQELDLLRASLSEALSPKDTKHLQGPEVAAEQLLKQVAVLSARFDQGEQERMSMALAFDDKLREKEMEIESIRVLLENGDSEENQHDRVVAISTAQGEMELQLQTKKRSKRSSKAETPAADKIEAKQSSDCGAWRLLSDCLPG